MSYVVEFEIGHDAEIYVSLRNTRNSNIVFREQITNTVVPIVAEHLDKLK